MPVKQISVLIENSKGSLASVTGILAEEKINCRSMCIADTKDYGILRIIADDPERAYKVLKSAGQAASLRELVGFEIPDEPGSLSHVLKIIEDADINMEYMYALVPKSHTGACVVMRVDDNARAESLLREHGISVLNGVNI